MKIAITTWYNGENAGTFFQLFGLYTYLKKRGHEVQVIRYLPQPKDFLAKGWEYYISQFKNIIIRKLKGHNEKEALNKLLQQYTQENELRKIKFKEMRSLMSFTQEIVSDTDFKELNQKFDAFIVGSDQVWNATMLNKRYFLDYVHPNKIKAAYAPSVGTGYIFRKAIKNYQKYLSTFNYISTRETKLQQTLNEILPIPVEHVLDPSMLISRAEYEIMAYYPLDIPKGSYILCYFMPNNQKEEQKVRAYAACHSLHIVSMTMFSYSYTLNDAIIYASAGPREYLGLISNAAVVMTSSFHCTIFSILFNKELFVFENRRSGKSADISLRYKEQLTAYGMGHRLITEEDDVTGNHLQPIDYKKVNEIFSQKLKRSQAFLNQFC